MRLEKYRSNTQWDNSYLRYWDNVEEIMKDWTSKGKPIPWGSGSGDVRQMEKLLLEGNPKLVDLAQKRIDDLTVHAESVMPMWEPDVMGPVVSVPSFLANVPTTFRRMRDVISDKSLLRIVVGISNSGGVNDEQVKERGITLLALIMKLQAIRPVEILLFEEGGANNPRSSAYIYLCKIETTPISLAHAAQALCDINFARNVFYGLAQYEFGRVVWPNDYSGNLTSGHRINPNYVAWRAEALNLQPNDLVLGSLYLGDEILQNPLGWINKHLALYSDEGGGE